MKRIVSLLLCLALTLSLALFTSCNESSSGSDSGNTENCQHTETELQVVLPATCTTDGKQAYICKKCGERVGEFIPITKLGHEFAAGFCVHTGCQTKDPSNNRFYANTLVSLLDTTYYNFANVGNITVTHGEDVYTLSDVSILGGKSEGALNENDNQPLAKDLLSIKIKGEGNLVVNENLTISPVDINVRIVNSDSELKLIVISNGEEQVYARVDNAVIVRTIEYIKEALAYAAGTLPDTEVSGSGTGVNYEELINSFIASIRTADGNDQTVSQINTALHNVIVSIADINKVGEGYEIVLSQEKIKAFNHTVGATSVESFVNNMFGDKSFDNIATLIRMAASAGQTGTESGTTPSFDAEAVIKDCSKLSLYDIINKYSDNETPTDYEAEINEIVDAFDGLTISYILDGQGNILKGKVKADKFTPIEDSSITIGGSTSTIPGFKIDGEFEINYKRERITGDEYKDFDDVIKTPDIKTDAGAGDYKGFVYNEYSTCQKITYTVDANGNIVGATSYFKIVKNYETGEADYYKVVCNNPVTVQRKLDEDGNLVYTLTNILTEKDYSVDLSIEVYVTDENWENATLADAETVESITGDIDEVEFTLVAKIVPENPTDNTEA